MYLLKSTFCCFCFSNYSKSSTLNPLSTLLFFSLARRKLKPCKKRSFKRKSSERKKNQSARRPKTH